LYCLMGKFLNLTMTEDYLHYIWKYKLFNQVGLKTTEEVEVEILNFGFHNHDSGPDFSQGKVKIGETLWAGNIEIHIRSSDWLRHNHQLDEAYDTVVLHVVYEHDQVIRTTKGSVIPTLELRSLIDLCHFENYQQFIFSSVPCEHSIQEVPTVIVSSMMEQMVTERLAAKAAKIKEDLAATHFDWEQVFFHYLAKAMGMKINSEPMLQMAKNTHLSILSKLGGNQQAIESILFGQAGFLAKEIPSNSYYTSLKKEYKYQQSKHNLIPIQKVFWKFSKLRPSNFPTVRIAQLSRLLSHTSGLFHFFVVSQPSYQDIQKQLTISIDQGFWLNHYTFETVSSQKKKSIGKSLVDSIIINTIAPFLYTYGEYQDNKEFIDRGIELLVNVPPERNKIIRIFQEKVRIHNAADSQGIIQCYSQYCVPKKCLDCSVGIHLLKQ